MGPHGATRLVAALCRFWYVRGHWSEGRSHLEAALARNGMGQETQAQMLGTLGFLVHSLGESRAGRASLEQALAINREIGERRGEAGNLSNLGNIARDLGKSAAARSWYGQSLTITREIGERWIEAANLNGLGSVACGQGDWAEARSHVEQSLAITREIGDRSKEVWNLSDLGQISRLEGDFGEARTLCVQSLTLASRQGKITDIAYTVEERAALAIAENAPPRAARLAGAAQAAREGISAILPPKQRVTHEQTLAAARAALGADTFSDAWDAGRAMTMEQVVECALSEGE